MLVTVQDLSDYMDRDLPKKARILNALTMTLEGLQSELESYLRRPIEVGTFTETINPFFSEGSTPYGSFYDYGYAAEGSTYFSPEANVGYSFGLLNSPVISVQSVYVTQTGTPSASTVVLNPVVDYVVNDFGISILGFYSNNAITVTYTAGLDGPDIKVFRQLILRAASREAQNLYDDNRGVASGLETTTVALAQTGFLDSELKGVKRYKRQRI